MLRKVDLVRLGALAGCLLVVFVVATLILPQSANPVVVPTLRQLPSETAPIPTDNFAPPTTAPTTITT